MAKSNNKKSRNPISYPAKLLKPVGAFLRDQLKTLKRQKKDIDSEDPFKNVDRISDNAAPDADAAEQDGHARVTAVKSHLDRKIIQTRKALARVKLGQYGVCEECGQLIDTDRLIIYPEATLCVKCESNKQRRE